jgi:hypothetical protein
MKPGKISLIEPAFQPRTGEVTTVNQENFEHIFLRSKNIDARLPVAGSTSS